MGQLRRLVLFYLCYASTVGSSCDEEIARFVERVEMAPKAVLFESLKSCAGILKANDSISDVLSGFLPDFVPNVIVSKSQEVPYFNAAAVLASIPATKFVRPYEWTDLSIEEVISRLRGGDEGAVYASVPLGRLPEVLRLRLSSFLCFEAAADCDSRRFRGAFWLNSPSMKATMHFDSSANLFLQLRGVKTFTLVPPEQWLDLRMFPAIHPAARQARGRSPLSGLEDVVDVSLAAGDVLYIPPFHFHAVLVSPGSSIDPLDSVALSVNRYLDSAPREIASTLLRGVLGSLDGVLEKTASESRGSAAHGFFKALLKRLGREDLPSLLRWSRYEALPEAMRKEDVMLRNATAYLGAPRAGLCETEVELEIQEEELHFDKVQEAYDELGRVMTAPDLVLADAIEIGLAKAVGGLDVYPMLQACFGVGGERSKYDDASNLQEL